MRLRYHLIMIIFRGTLRRGLLAMAVALSPFVAAHAANLQTAVTFTDTTPLASAHEILRRAFTPITAAPVGGLQGLPLDVSKETFSLYVPDTKPANGYGLMVFVPPWDGAAIPQGWASALDDAGIIFVAANNSGNDAPVHVRRMPLALIAAVNVMHRYQVDPSRVFVAGMSGGSRVALRLALAYPDVFVGAFLNSGSDPIGTAQIPLPPADLFQKFQTSSRIYYVTGDLDRVPYNDDRASARSLADFCVANVQMVTMWGKAHVTAEESVLSNVLDGMFKPASGSDDMAACRAKLASDVQAQLQKAETLIATGDKPGARQLLQQIDEKYGGLAAPRSIALNGELH